MGKVFLQLISLKEKKAIFLNVKPLQARRTSSFMYKKHFGKCVIVQPLEIPLPKNWHCDYFYFSPLMKQRSVYLQAVLELHRSLHRLLQSLYPLFPSLTEIFPR